MDDVTYGIVDIGGTKIVAGVATPSEMLGVVRVRTDAPEGADAVIARVAAAIRGLLAELPASRRLAGVGVSVPGPLDRRTGVVSFTPNLAWIDYPVGARLAASLDDIPVFIDDDTNCAALGEATHGAGVGVRDQVFLTISTGIGGGVIVDGRIHRGWQDAAGEVGHMTIIPGGPDCGCGNSGCMEAVASGTAIARRGRQLLYQERDGILASLVGRDADLVDAAVVFEAAGRGDISAGLLLDDVASYLAIGLANIVHVLNPELVVLGGGVMDQADVLLPKIDARLRTHLFRVQRAVRVVRGTLGDRAGLWGALELVRAELGEASAAGGATSRAVRA